MKGLITTIKNIWKIKELRDRILYTLALLFVFRLGSHILLPGVIPGALKNAIGGSGNANDLIGLINIFTGGAFNNSAIQPLIIFCIMTL